MKKEDLIKKWLNDELTPAEKNTFEQGDDFALNHAIIEGAKQFKASSFSEPKTFEDFQASYQKEKSNVKQLNWFKPLLRIASVIVVALGLYFTLFNSDEIVIQTIVSQKTNIELPDHSKVVMNANSEIKYNESDWNNERQLHLDGEAYFKVAKGKTFKVITSQGVVRVVGTEFNVLQRPNYFEVQCYEGVVEVTSKLISKTLKAGDTYRLLNETFSQNKINTTIPQWTQNKSYFNAIPLKNVISELERQYEINIDFKDVDLNRLFTGGFTHDNINNALLSVTEPMGLSYKTKDSNDIIIYGDKK